MDGTTIVVGLVAALVGGTVGAGITVGGSLALARRASRERAAEALWEYQRALSGFAAKVFGDVGYSDEQAFIATADFSTLREAHKAAYAWSGYLNRAARDRLFRIAYLNIGYPPYDDDVAGVAAQKLADALEDQLDRIFPLRFSDRFTKHKRD